MAQTTRLTVILSLPAYLYIANTELANNLKKITKACKKYLAHSGQLAYVYWINCVLDSATIIGRHGLIPEPSNDVHLKELFPPVSVIVDHFKAKDKTQTKQQCNDVVQHLFCSGKDGLLGAVAHRLFKAEKFYNKPTTILIYHKLCHAEALRILHPRTKNAAFGVSSLYRGCRVLRTSA